MNFKLTPFSLLAAIALTACAPEHIEVPKSELYAREFIKEFGVFDQNHDWNGSTRRCVTVTPGPSGKVQIYTKKFGDIYGMVGDFQDVNGTKTLWFDTTHDTDEILVISDGRSARVKAGASVDLSSRGSRSFIESSIASIANDYSEISIDAVRSYERLVPEDVHNVSKVTNNFSYVSQGPFKFYPVYWQTGSTHELGVYYNENGELKKVPIYTSKSGDVLQYSSSIIIASDNNEYNNYNWKVGDTCDHGHKITRIDENGKKYYETTEIPKEECNAVVYYKLGQKCEHCGQIITESILNESGKHIRHIDNEWGGYDQECQSNVTDPQIGNICSNNKIISEFNQYDHNKHYHFGEEQAVEHECTDSPIWKEGDIYVDNEGNSHKVISTGINQWGKSYFTINGKWENAGENNANEAYPIKTDLSLRAKAITVDLPKGTEFGFYIVVDGKHTLYSEEEMNKTQEDSYNLQGEKGLWKPNKVEETGYSWASTFTTTVDGVTRTFFGFEDWAVDEVDLNDLIFMFDDKSSPSDNPVTVDKDPSNKWIIACEDLGMLDDFDFNDVVFGVTYTNGHKEAYITPLASGGTLPIQLWRRDKKDGTETHVGGKEWHELFGESAGTPVNVNAGADGRSAGQIVIPVPEDFTMSHRDGAGHGDLDNMGGFYVKVERKDGKWDKVTAPQKGEAPQMILIQATTVTGDKNGNPDESFWRWMRERQHITWGYEGFGEWGKNYHNHDWHTTIKAGNDSKVVNPYKF